MSVKIDSNGDSVGYTLCASDGCCYGRPLSVSGRPCYILPMFFTRHSLVERRARYLFYCMFFCLFGQRFLDNPRVDSRHILHADVAWVGTCLLPFWGLAAPGGRKKMKFSLLWSQWGIFCILAVFERYLSNA